MGKSFGHAAKLCLQGHDILINCGVAGPEKQDEKDDQGPREAKTGSNAGARLTVDGPQSGKAANKFEPPTWNDLRGLGPEERRLVIEYFRRLNGKSP